VKPRYRELRLKQLERSLAPFEVAKQVTRPSGGWLRSVRQALGLSLDAVGRSIGTGRQHVMAFENAEAADRITLGSLRKVARAMDCDLVYALVPTSGSITSLSEKSARNEATKRVLAVEHSMALEDQATGNIEQRINEETKRIRKGQ
jgi:predicted DNA-binding mobile mystery protein A